MNPAYPTSAEILAKELVDLKHFAKSLIMFPIVFAGMITLGIHMNNAVVNQS